MYSWRDGSGKKSFRVVGYRQRYKQTCQQTAIDGRSGARGRSMQEINGQQLY